MGATLGLKPFGPDALHLGAVQLAGARHCGAFP